MQYGQASVNSYGAGAGTALSDAPGYAPGTLAAVQARLSELVNRSAMLSSGMCEIRDRLAGTSQAGEAKGHPTPVPNGIIDALEATINTIMGNLTVAESAQKSVFDKLG